MVMTFFFEEEENQPFGAAWKIKGFLLHLSSLQISRSSRVLVKASCRREVESHPRASRPLASPSLAPLLICPSLTRTICCRGRASACPSLWMIHSESWTSFRKTHLSSWKRTAGMGRSPRAVTPHWLCSTKNASRSAALFSFSYLSLGSAPRCAKVFLFFVCWALCARLSLGHLPSR